MTEMRLKAAYRDMVDEAGPEEALRETETRASTELIISPQPGGHLMGTAIGTPHFGCWLASRPSFTSSPICTAHRSHAQMLALLVKESSTVVGKSVI